MLDEKDLQAIAQLLARQESGLLQAVDAKLAQQKEEILDETTHRMNVLLETKVEQRLSLMMESQKMMNEKLDGFVTGEEFEDRISTLEGVVSGHSREISELKKAN